MPASMNFCTLRNKQLYLRTVDPIKFKHFQAMNNKLAYRLRLTAERDPEKRKSVPNNICI